MKLLYVLTAFLALSSPSLANHPVPDPPEGGINFFYQAQCSDNETGESGMCYVGRDNTGQVYMTFYQGEKLMFIRRVIPGGYETIWVADN